MSVYNKTIWDPPKLEVKLIVDFAPMFDEIELLLHKISIIYYS